MTKRKEKDFTSPRFILLQDCALSLVASLLSILLVRWLSDPIPGFTLSVAKWLLTALAGSLIGFIATGSWRNVRRYFTLSASSKAILAIIIKAIFLTAILVFGFVKLPSASYSVLAVTADILLTGVFLLYIRVASQILSPASKDQVRENASRKNALIAGTTPGAVKLAEITEDEGIYDVSGFVTTNPELAGRVIADKVVYYCDDPKNIDKLHWKVGGVDAILFPRDYDLSEPDGTPESSGSDGEKTPEKVVNNDGMSFTELVIKRGFDLSLSGILLVVFSPLLAICAIAVKMEDGGPVFFKQERIGRGGKPFTIYKLRSMRIDAEASGKPELFQGEDDTRLTKTGRFLRNHHLDELPQLYNVFKGDMSFIGHRPERKFYIDKIMACDPRYRYLYQIRPGVTSYATLYNGYTDTIDKMLTRLDLDLYYLRNRSVWFDVKVLGLTFLSIISGKRF